MLRSHPSATRSVMARVNLTLDPVAYEKLSRYAKASGSPRDAAARSLLCEALASHANLRSRIVPRSPKVRRRCRGAPKPQGQLELPLPELMPSFGDHVDLLQLVKAPAPRARELDWPSLLN